MIRTLWTVVLAALTAGLCEAADINIRKSGAPQANARPVLKLALTFDDGTKDHLAVAAPLLAKHGWQGTFNIVTDWVGRPNKMSWDDIRELQRQGHVITSHTLSHPHLATLLAKGETNEVRRQYRASREALLRETGRSPRYMCYPFTERNAATDALCREEGMLPMTVWRANFGKGTKAGTPTGIGAAIDRWIADGRTRMDVLVHGVCPGGGWMPFDSEADYAAFLDELAERERRGQVKVVTYDELYDFPDVTRWHGANLLGLFNAAPKKPDPRVHGRFDEKHFRWFREWGFNFARLPMDYRYLLATNDWTQLKQEGFAKVDEAVAWGRQYGVHVQLCLHRAPGFTIASWVPEAKRLQTDADAQEAFMRIWREFARRYRGIPNVELSFNLINEPQGFSEQQFIDVFGRTIDAIRAEDPDRFVMLDGNNVASTPVAHFYKVPLTGQAFRGYTPHAISHYGAWYIKDQPEVEPTWPLSPEMATRKKWIYEQPETTFAKYGAPRKIGYPVMVGEFGCYSKVSHGTCLKWMEHCLKIWKEHGLGWAIWNVDGAFGFIDSGRADVDYEDFEGHKLDRKMLDLLRRYAAPEPAAVVADWRIVAAEQATSNLVLVSGAPGAKAEFLWRWDPAKDPGIKPGDARLFAAIDECKVREHGDYVLVNASCGSVAGVDVKKGCVRWYANAGTDGAGPHSVDVLPDNCIAVANSTDRNALQIIDAREHPLDPARQKVRDVLPVSGAHGVVFDWKRYTLFVLGYTNLYEVAYRPKDMSVKVLRQWDFSKACGDAWGHDLVPDGRRGYYLTNHTGVWHFDPDTEKFTPALDRANVKSFSRDEAKGDLLSVPRERWWTDRLIVRTADGRERVVGPFPGARFYKARWVDENVTGAASIDFTKAAGPVKPLHGVDNAPLRVTPGSTQHEFKAAGIPFMRTHDTAGMWGGTHYVDIPNLFPDFDADENDPKSYDFAFTDAYLKPVVESGAEIFYRLGVTIENYYKIKAYNIAPPKDFAKWARVCEHVVRHYNEGWADGFKWNIRYWEVWNEPENPPMWSGTRAEFYELYRVTANHLKRCFPQLKVGGYGGCGFYAKDLQMSYEFSDFYATFVPWFEDFCKFTRDPKTACPLDFFSWHLYTSEPERIIRHADYVRRTLDANGLRSTESVFNEWNCMIATDGRTIFETMKEAPGAAFVAAAFALMQAGSVDSAMYYDALPTRSYCGLFYFPSVRTTPCYEVFRAFNELYRLGTSATVSCDAPHVYLAAAKGADGAAAILAANYSWPCDAKTRRVTTVVVGENRPFVRYRVDETCHQLTEVGTWRPGEPLVLEPFETCLLMAGRRLDGAPVLRQHTGALNGIAQ